MRRLYPLTNPDPVVDRYITHVWALIKAAK
jgi:hypothetical protein